MTRRIRLTLASVLAVAAFGSVVPQAGAYVYWSNISEEDTYLVGTIGRANNDGTNPQPNFISGIGLVNPLGLAVNDNFIYWTDNGTAAIGRATLGGLNPNTSFIRAPAVRSPAVDGNYIYWPNAACNGLTCSNSIGRASLNGTGANQSFIAGAPDPEGGQNVQGVAVDDTYVYWTNAITNTIGRASLNGSNVNQSFITSADGPIPSVAVEGDYLYWTNLGTNTIGRASLNGSNVNQSFITGASGPLGVAADGNNIYWANIGLSSPTIARATLDDSGQLISVDQSFITGGSSFSPGAVAADSLSPSGSLDPGRSNFGNQQIGGTTAASTFILTSSGNADLGFKANGIRLTGEDADQFQITDGGTCQVGTTSLPDGDSCTVQVTFAPTSVGDKQATLSVATNAGVKTADLEGVGTSSDFSISPFGRNFGNRPLFAGASRSASFTLLATGSNPLLIQPGGVTLAGTNPGQFRITASNCPTGSLLEPGETCSVDVAFNPSRAGDAAAALTFETGSGFAEADLNGTGTVDPVLRRLGRPGRRALKVRVGCGNPAPCTLALTINRVRGGNPLLYRTIRVGASRNPRLTLRYTSLMRSVIRRDRRLRIIAINRAAGTRAAMVVNIRR